jgi:hypothetical protein
MNNSWGWNFVVHPALFIRWPVSGCRDRSERFHPNRNWRTLHIDRGIRNGPISQRRSVHSSRRMSSRWRSGARKIAALAEARHVGFVPYNPLSPVSTAACLQIAATAPNFALQEYPIGKDVVPKTNMVAGMAEHDGNGYLMISDAPGIGLELKTGTVKNCPEKPREVITRLDADGSVIDQ